jgi:hypothetical protein
MKTYQHFLNEIHGSPLTTGWQRARFIASLVVGLPLLLIMGGILGWALIALVALFL